jgi:hypothetical protein
VIVGFCSDWDCGIFVVPTSDNFDLLLCCLGTYPQKLVRLRLCDDRSLLYWKYPMRVKPLRFDGDCIFQGEFMVGLLRSPGNLSSATMEVRLSGVGHILNVDKVSLETNRDGVISEIERTLFNIGKIYFEDGDNAL